MISSENGMDVMLGGLFCEGGVGYPNYVVLSGVLTGSSRHLRMQIWKCMGIRCRY